MSALLELEQPLVDLKNMAGLLGHLSTSECEVAGEELAHIQLVLLECHEDLHSWWDDAIHKNNGEEHEEEVASLKAELAACKASHAPPGGEADAELARACWWLLVNAARTVISAAEEAGVMSVETAASGGGGG
jgi:hypothetical protein